MQHPTIRWGSVSVLALGAVGLALLAPFATPLGFPKTAFGVNGWAAIRGISPFNRDLQYLLLVLSGIALCAALRLVGPVDLERVRTAASGPICDRLVPWIVIATTSALAGILAMGNLADAFTSRDLPLHEGEWLGYLSDDGPFLHGWMINVLPTRLCRDLGLTMQTVGCARVVRIGWACASYLVVPVIFYQLFRYDLRRWPAAVATVGATLAFALADQKLYGFYNSGFESLSTAPVRGTPLLIVLALAAGVCRATRCQVPLGLTALPAFAIPFAFLANILSGPLGVALLIALAAAVTVSRSWRDGLVALAWMAGGLGVGAVFVAAMLPEPLAASWQSFRYFGTVGRTIFADETPWLAAGGRLTLLLRYSEIPLYVGVIAVAVVAAFSGLRAGTFRVFLLTHLPALLIAFFCALTFFLVTGVAVSAFGLAILIPYLLVRYLQWRCPSGRLPVLAWPYLAGAAFVLISAGVMMTSSTYFGIQAARGALATPDSSRPGYRQADRLRQELDGTGQTCMVSLTSDGTLLLAARRPSCLSRHQPLYAASVMEQQRAVAELARIRPRLIHASSVVIDNPYVIQTHAPAIWAYIEDHYYPKFILDGRWFWERRKGPAEPWSVAAEVQARMGRIVRRDREAIVVEWPVASTGQSQVGIALRCANGRICALGVGEVRDGRMTASIKTPPPATEGRLDVLVWVPERRAWQEIARSAS